MCCASKAERSGPCRFMRSQFKMPLVKRPLSLGAGPAWHSRSAQRRWRKFGREVGPRGSFHQEKIATPKARVWCCMNLSHSQQPIFISIRSF